MGRMLVPEEFGLLTSLSSFFILFGIFSYSFSTIFAKLTAKYSSTNEVNLNTLIGTGTKAILIFSLVVFVILLILTKAIMSFLRIDSFLLLLLTYFSVVFAILSSLPTGFLQGRMQFYLISFLNILYPVVKVVAGLSLVYFGFRVFGAIGAIALSGFIPLLISFGVIFKNYKKTDSFKNTELFMKEFSHYSYTYFLSALGMTLLSNTDILLVRHFFPEVVSGQYAALSLMGKAIFYITAPINFVFFPLIAQKKEKNERLFETVVLALGIVLLASVTLSFIYFAFPNLILLIFFPAVEYKVLASYLGFFSLYILMFSLCSLSSSFFLSIGKTDVYKYTILAAILQIALIAIFHNSLYQVIGALFFVSLLLFLFFLVYYLKHGKD